jgi:hypothetical protein
MGFASARAADEDRVALGVEEGAGGEFANLSFIDGRVGEDERVDILGDRELGSGDAIADRSGLPVGAFGPDQAGDQRIEFVAAGDAVAGDLVETGAHAVKLQLAHRLHYLMAFHQAIFLMPS